MQTPLGACVSCVCSRGPPGVHHGRPLNIESVSLKSRGGFPALCGGRLSALRLVCSVPGPHTGLLSARPGLAV